MQSGLVPVALDRCQHQTVTPFGTSVGTLNWDQLSQRHFIFAFECWTRKEPPDLCTTRLQ